MRDAKQQKSVCSHCTQAVETKRFVDRVFSLISKALVCGTSVTLPVLGVLEVRSVPARELEDAFFHRRLRPIKTVILKPNRALVMLLNGFKYKTPKY